MSIPDQSRHSSTALAAQSQALLDRFTTHASQRLITGRDPTPAEAADMSMELMSVPEQDAIREKLDSRAKELEQERQRFTVAAVKLGKEKAALAVCPATHVSYYDFIKKSTGRTRQAPRGETEMGCGANACRASSHPGSRSGSPLLYAAY